MVKTLCFHCRWHGFEPGWGTKIPHAMQRGQKVKINLKLKNKKIYIYKKRGRDRGKVAIGDGAEIGGMQPQAQECQEPLGARGGGKDLPLELSEGTRPC